MRLPPELDSLKQHIMPANYLAYIQRHPDEKEHPSPIGHGWELVNGRCKPVRHTEHSLPATLPDELHEQLEDNSDFGAETDESDVSDSEIDTSFDELD